MAADASSSDQANAVGRQQLARMVVIGSFLTIFLLVAMLLAISQLGSQKASDLAEKAFNAILPVLASWVGTVLAFFFSSQSLERTSSSLDTAIRAAGGAGDGKTVTEVMIPLGQIREVIHLDKTPAKDLTLKDLQGRFHPLPSATTGGSSGTATLPAVTRLVFVDGDVFRYVLHESTLNAFLVSKAGSSPQPSSFEEMRQEPAWLAQISRLVVFVAASTKLSDASAALDRVKGAQDIIVTATGNSSEPMLGWITNVDLVKVLQGP